MKVLQLALFASTMLAPTLALAATPAPTALPTGPSVVAGQATVSQSGAALVVTETSSKAILNWQSFDIGSASSVTFVQPNAGAMVLNRVLGADPSRIDGALHANGQIILINPNGLVFGAGATVDVGGIIASSLDISNANFLSGALSFNRTGSSASVVNNGAIRAANGGYVALLGSQLANRGMIQANFGTVAMAAGDRVTMTLAGHGLVGISVDPAAVKTQIDQGGAIVAGDGSVWLTAKAESALLGGVINASGSIEANSLTAKGGAIVLDATGPITLAGADFSATGATGGGAIRIGGLDNASTSIGQGSVLDASATLSGEGGAVETSGQTLSIGAATIRTAGAGGGAAGSWLLDPYDLTINQTAAATIDTALGLGGVTIKTSAISSIGAGVSNPLGSGDIIIAAPIAWAANTILTLDAYHSVIAKAAITASGATSGLAITTNDGGSGGQLTFTAPVTLPTTGSVTINSASYALINSVGGLQAIGLTGNYALVGGVNLGSTGGFTPLDSAGFTGAFEGLGNTISGLTITASTAPDVGLFGLIGAGGRVENLALTGASVSQGAANVVTLTSDSGVGILAGENDGAIYNVSSAGSVTAGSDNQGSGAIPSVGGGLVGLNTGTIDHSSSSATVTGSVIASPIGNSVGGLAGINWGGQISNSYATGAVTGGPAATGAAPPIGGDAGGLVGANEDHTYTSGGPPTIPAVITNSYATGTATGGSGAGGPLFIFILGGGGRAGGLVGENSGTINSSYATGAAIGGASTGQGQGGAAGGLVGYNVEQINDSYARGAATGGVGLDSGQGGPAGGLVGYNGFQIANSYATGLVTGGLALGVAGATGGLVGDSNANPLTAMTGDYWNITTTGQATDAYTVGVTGLTTVQWLTRGPGVPGSASGWDFTSTWLQGYPYPVLKALPYITVSASAAGSYGGTLSINQSGVTATDQNGANALGLINISGISLIGGSTGAVATLSDLGGAGVTVTAASPYQIVYAPVTATINPATLTWSVADVSSTYGTRATPGAATLSGFVGGDASSVVGAVGVYNGAAPVTLAANTAAGGYSEVVTGLSGSKAADYVLANTGNSVGTLTINPLAVTLTGSRTYDGSTSIAGGALSASGLIGGDSLAIGGAAVLAAKDAGPEAIVSTAGLILSNPNYTVAGVGGTVTITPLAVNLTGSRTYDGSTSIAGGALSASNLIGGDSLAIGGAATLAAKDAGSEALASTAGLTLSNPNYTLTGVTGAVTINPATLTITANDASVVSGAALPRFSVSYSGFVAGETSSLVQGLSVTTKATAGSAPGAYVITPEGATAPNYDVTYVDGVLSIKPGQNTLVGKILASTVATTNAEPGIADASVTGDAASNGVDTIVLPNPDGGSGAVLQICSQAIGGAEEGCKGNLKTP